MRDYRRKKQTKYILPSAVYHKTLWTIRDYYRLKESAADCLTTPAIKYDSEKVQKSNTNDQVFETVLKREKYVEITLAIDKALNEIPPEYRKGVWENIQKRKAYPLDADRTTYGRYKSKFIYRVAEKLKYI